MKMQISKFWRTLDDLLEAATDRREWQALLGREYGHVSALLTPSGPLATSVSCPSPGGDGCPRKIVRHDDGSIRAICGDSPKACRDLDLTREDITVLEVDRAKLSHAVASALGLSNIPSRVTREIVVQIGTHDVFAGLGFPVFLAVPGPRTDDGPVPYQRVLAAPGPKLLLAPTYGSIPEAVTAILDREGVTRLALADILTGGDKSMFRPVLPVARLLAALRAQVDQHDGTASMALAWQLPPDARWEEISIRFTASEVVNVSFRGDTRRFEPVDLGMKSAKNGRPKAIWIYLKAFAQTRGRLPVHRGDPRETSKHQKQKQSLSQALRDAFGIAGEPIPTEGGEYVTRFLVNADDLLQGRQGQSQRNFVGDD